MTNHPVTDIHHHHRQDSNANHLSLLALTRRNRSLAAPDLATHHPWSWQTVHIERWCTEPASTFAVGPESLGQRNLRCSEFAKGSRALFRLAIDTRPERCVFPAPTKQAGQQARSLLVCSRSHRRSHRAHEGSTNHRLLLLLITHCPQSNRFSLPLLPP